MSKDNSLQAFTETLRMCQEGIDTWRAQKAANDEIASFNSNQNSAYAAAVAAWQGQVNNLNTDYATRTANWHQCVFNKTNEYKNMRRSWNNCVVWNETHAGRHNDWCQNDTGMEWHVGQEGGGCWGGQGKGVCGYSDNQSATYARRDCGLEPSAPNLPAQPNQGQFPHRQQNLTPLTLNCCANYAQVVGSSMDDSVINQSNQCIAGLEQKINDLQNQPETTTPAPTTSLAPLPVKAENKKATQPGNFKNYLWIIVLVVLCSMFSSSIISVVLMMSNNTEE